MVTAETLLREAATVSDGHARGPTGPADQVDGTTPTVVLEPTSVQGVAAALRWASTAGLSVVLRGAGTKDTWGRAPRPVDVLLRLNRLNRIVEHEASDLTATVEAGATLGDVNRAFALHGQCLPLDPPHSADATIGGVLATNDTGPLRHRFGTPRDLLIGMTIVMADGSVSSSGGRVVKNVAGYDIGRLMAGSHGSLAAIVSASFKLSPRPPASGTLRVHLARASDVVAFAELLRQHQAEPETFELHLSRTAGVERISALVRHATIAGALDDACRQTIACADQIGASAERVEGDEADRWWADHVGSPAGHGRVHLRLSWKPADFERAAAALAAAAGDADFDWIGRAAVGSGVVGIGGAATHQVAVVEALRSGSPFSHVVVVDAPAEIRRLVDVWPIASAQQTVWQALKTACDPRHTLAAGRGPL